MALTLEQQLNRDLCWGQTHDGMWRHIDGSMGIVNTEVGWSVYFNGQVIAAGLTAQTIQSNLGPYSCNAGLYLTRLLRAENERLQERINYRRTYIRASRARWN